MFAYCGNNPINFKDPYGTYMVPDDMLHGTIMMHIGGSGLGASSAGVGGGSGGLPVPMVDLSLYDVSKIVDIATDTADIVNGLGTLSRASDYGIKGYSTLKKELAGTGLEAHHIVEVRFLNGKKLDTKNALSVAVTKQEHQRFTNEWRRHFPYGKTSYKTLQADEIWAAAQKIYRNYPDLLDAVWDTLY